MTFLWAEACPAVEHKDQRGHMPLMNQIRGGICPTAKYAPDETRTKTSIEEEIVRETKR